MEAIGSGATEDGSTHQRMELAAAVEGLAAVPEGSVIELVSDSTDVVDSLGHGYLERWRTRGWRKVSHTELWRGFAALSDRRCVLGTWVRAHAGDEADPWNVMVDHVAKTARRVAEAA
jgi:ribonuclease HI